MMVEKAKQEDLDTTIANEEQCTRGEVKEENMEKIPNPQEK
jgi:hypothetical protein